ncbi:hypothetical protein [Bacillus paranthracis]|uniref:hypothetical protein n=1 Tax=Bacillus paranthracis TaxID=2026186 RepID=UPI002D782E1B|nr:hypothetical protein [Bacillus paranthracis]
MSKPIKPTFDELRRQLRENPPKCKCCEKVLPAGFNLFREATKLTDVDGERLAGFYCRDCSTEALAYLMNERFVEVYEGNLLFCKDGRYSPWWGCPYYFKTIEECRIRIDNAHLSIVPTAVIGALLGKGDHDAN